VVSKTHRLLKDRGVLILTKIKNKKKKEFFFEKDISEITDPLQLTFSKVEQKHATNKNSIYVDEHTIQFPLTLRKWKEGDFFYPKGMNGKKKISKYFKDQKFSLFDKENVWLLCSQNEIIWVVGHRQDERFYPNPSSNLVLKITYMP